jgi:hypothetical protein
MDGRRRARKATAALLVASLLVLLGATARGGFGRLSARGSAEAAPCSKASALETAKRIRLRESDYLQGVFQVLCGPFAGPRSRIMVASYFGPGNSGVVDWAVFRAAGDLWQLVLTRHEGVRLAAVRSDFEEIMSVYRSGDPRCCPSGGTRSRVWRWNGSRFVASAWKYSGR